MVSNRSNGSSGSNKTRDLGGFGYLAAVILCCLIVGGLAFGLGRENERRYEAPASYTKAAKADAQSACIDREGTAAFECIYEKVEAAQEQARGEQDLSAQQKAANAALISAIVAFATLILSGVGVWYVKRTLDATLKAVEDTGKATDAMVKQNELTETAQRPWVQITVEPISFIADAGMISIAYDVVFTNIGKSIAFDFQSDATSGFVKAEFEQNKEFMLSHRDKAIKKDRREGYSLLPGEVAKNTRMTNTIKRSLPWVGTKPNRCVKFMVCATCFYRVNGEGHWLETTRHFTIGASGDPFEQRMIREGCETIEPTNIAVHSVGANETT